ncbi:MAG TPA: 30S ribosomal protein S11 [Planctomycetes bacterium]|nr:30S ribosomal protein S11 [Planctomycetota bacterium]
MSKQQQQQSERPAQEPQAQEGPPPASGGKKKQKLTIAKAIVHIKATFNNTIITLTDRNGNTLVCGSSGTVGYKGSRKSTPFAAQRAAEKVAEKARKLGVREIEIRVKGPGAGRESAIRAFQQADVDIKVIEDVTPLPHNGCRPKKRRRV